MNKKIFIAAIVIFLFITGIFFAMQAGPKQTVCKDCNVILITMTNLRYDHMSSNGYQRLTTPNLDKLAEESLMFDNAFSHASWTLPEAISIYTSLYPFEHGVMNRYDGSTLPKATQTLIDRLKKAGYKTAAFTGGFDYNPDFGLTSRFDEYQECPKSTLPLYPRQASPRVLGPDEYGEFSCTIPQALEWLKTNASQKFFLHVQGFDAHCPFSQKGGKTYDKDYQGKIDYSRCLWTFEQTEPIIKNNKTYYQVYSWQDQGAFQQILLGKEDISHLAAIYDEGITSADFEIGKFLDEVKALGLWDKTIIIFTSEHGDIFGKYGRFMRGGPLRGTFYDDVLHIPLLVKHPKLGRERIDGLVGQIDLAPTILDFTGLNINSFGHGKSLIPLITQKKAVNQYIFAGSDFTPQLDNLYFNKKTKIRAVRDKNWKLIQETVFGNVASQSTQLFNIQKDKEELYNMVMDQDKKEILQKLLKELDKW